MPSKDHLNVALVGYGMAGQVFHAPLIGATHGLCLHSIVSTSPEKVRRDFPDVPVRTDFAAVLADESVDLIVLATPDHLHAEQGIAALDAGKHVVVEKPFALSVREAKPVVARAHRTGRLLSVFHNRRWDSDFLTIRKLVEEQALGEIHHFESHFDRYRPTVLDRWKDERSAGLWQDLGPHLVDQVLQLFGMPHAIFADFAVQKSGGAKADYFHVLLRYDQLRVMLHASQTVPVHDLRFAIHGKRGSFIKRGTDPQEAAMTRGISPGGEHWGQDDRPGQLWRTSAEATAAKVDHSSVPGDYPAYYRAVRDAILSGMTNPVPAEEALRVMAVLDAGRLSSDERREIMF